MVVIALIIVIPSLLFKNLESDGKVLFESIVPILGYFAGIIVAIGKSKKDRKRE